MSWPLKERGQGARYWCQIIMIKKEIPVDNFKCAGWPSLWWFKACECWRSIMQIFFGGAEKDSVLQRPLSKHGDIINAKYKARPSWSPWPALQQSISEWRPGGDGANQKARRRTLILTRRLWTEYTMEVKSGRSSKWWDPLTHTGSRALIIHKPRRKRINASV